MKETTKNRITFVTRLVSWLGIGCGIPIGVFAYKFGLFKETTVLTDELGNVITETSLSLNGWGIVSCLLVGTFLSSIFKEVYESCEGYSLMKQCYKGICSTIPLIVAFAICYFLKGVIDQIMFCLITIIICKLISTPLNPLPKWKYEKLGKEDYSSITEALTNFVKEHTKRGEK